MQQFRLHVGVVVRDIQADQALAFHRRGVPAHPGDRERLSAALVAALNLKPERHHFDAQEQVQVLRFMSMTGG